jgi:hypothetical protein
LQPLGKLRRLVIPSASAASPSSSNKGKAGGSVPRKLTAGEEFLTGLISGAAAGVTVDLTLFPLDTIKTRLQARAESGFSLDIFKVGRGEALFLGCSCAGRGRYGGGDNRRGAS